MDERLRMALRTAQTWAPWLVDVKADAQALVRRVRRRPFEDDFRALPLLGLPAGARCLDVGANRGQSVDAIRLMLPDAEITAFEPNPDLAARLGRRRPDVDVRPVALGRAPGRFDLFVPAYRGYVFDGLASLDEESARTWLEGRLLRFDPARLELRRFHCEVQRLDDLELQPDFVKIDVQGLEQEVLEGGIDTLRRCTPVLLVETPGSAVASLLAEVGYRPHAFDGRRLVPGSFGPLNTFFVVAEAR